MVRQWGYTPEDFIGQPVGAFFHPDDLERIAERRSALLRGEQVPSGECRLRRADGRWIWTESNPALIRDGDGAVLGIVVVLRDIDQRKQAETALIDSEARFRILADSSSDVLLRYDAGQRIAYASPSVRQWGYTPEDFIGQRAGVFVHPDDAERIAERRAAMLAGEPVQTVEARIRRADGNWTWIESNPSQIRDENGVIVGAVLVLRDINQRKLAEAALIESEARYRMLADNTSDIIQRFNADGIVRLHLPPRCGSSATSRNSSSGDRPRNWSPAKTWPTWCAGATIFSTAGRCRRRSRECAPPTGAWFGWRAGHRRSSTARQAPRRGQRHARRD